MPTNTLKDNALLDTIGAAYKLGLQPSTLKLWRHKKIGPKYIKVGRSIRYSLADLEEYIEEHGVSHG